MGLLIAINLIRPRHKAKGVLLSKLAVRKTSSLKATVGDWAYHCMLKGLVLRIQLRFLICRLGNSQFFTALPFGGAYQSIFRLQSAWNRLHSR